MRWRCCMRTRAVRWPISSMMKTRPPEWIWGKRASISASTRAISRPLVTEPCVDMPGVSNFCHLAALAILLILPACRQDRNPRMIPMQHMLRLTIAAFMAVALTHFPGVAAAQGAVKQVLLTAKHIEGFIAAQKDMATVAEKMQSNSDKPDPKVQAELESIAKKHGFAS